MDSHREVPRGIVFHRDREIIPMGMFRDIKHKVLYIYYIYSIAPM
jgi:hypothetical protein